MKDKIDQIVYGIRVQILKCLNYFGDNHINSLTKQVKIIITQFTDMNNHKHILKSKLRTALKVCAKKIHNQN